MSSGNGDEVESLVLYDDPELVFMQMKRNLSVVLNPFAKTLEVGKPFRIEIKEVNEDAILVYKEHVKAVVVASPQNKPPISFVARFAFDVDASLLNKLSWAVSARG